MSTRKHNIFSHEDALNNAGCIQILTDKVSRNEFKRKSLTACMDYFNSETLLSFTAWTYLTAPLSKLPNLCAKLKKMCIKLVSLQNDHDTSTTISRFTMQIPASLAEYNSNLIFEGCKAGIEAAPKRGGQVREIGMHQDEEAEEESCHPALQGRNDYTENNGNNRH